PPLHTGAGLQAHAIARILYPGVETSVVTLGACGLPPTETHHGLRIRRLGSATAGRAARDFGMRVFPYLMRLRPAPDLVKIVGVGPAAYAALVACRLRRLPAIVKLTLEGEDDPAFLRRKAGGRWRLRLLRWADRLICPSRRLEEIARSAGFDPQRVIRIPNGVDLERFAPQGHASLSEWIYVGTLVERKRVHLLLEVLSSLGPHYPELRLHLVGGLKLGAGLEPQREPGATARPRPGRESVPAGGSGAVDALKPAVASKPGPAGVQDTSYLEHLSRLAETRPLQGRVIFRGSLAHPEEVLRSCGIFLLASTAEGLPNALLEAMACGLVPVVSDLPAHRELISPGENGILVPPDDTAAWVRALERLLENPQRAHAMGRAARATMERGYDLRETASAYLRVYRSL
ncbi:MAG: glycosyltransferase family 4 protein, partial [Candidatus Eisenbacteria sp.]|nr:glycosyltransferase family 4 protein [Candidatus Eisenbacteria bacterium]